MPADGHRLRLGTVSYLNALPLVHGLDRRADLAVSALPPSAVAAGLRDGTLDAGLVPVVELLRQPDLAPLSTSVIGADGPVWSVLLLLRRAPDRVRTLSLDPHSRTSQVLARLVLERVHGAVPGCRERKPEDDPVRDLADAVLVIGDAALRLHHDRAPHLDLGAAWRSMTGSPFVFAAWAARKDVLRARPDLPAVLDAARDAGIASIPAIAAAAAPACALPEGLVRVYLQERIRYRLGAAESAGLATFLDLAKPLAGPLAPKGWIPACSTSASSETTPTR